MMSLSTPTARLCWKETRQALPLAVALLCLTALLMLVMAYLTWMQDVQMTLAMLSLVPPILFAVGAGAILVGSEKEARSLTWLTSLPIGPRELVLNPFVVGLVGLLALWMITGLIQAIAAAFSTQSFPDRLPASFQLRLFVNSIYLLICGFTTAWMARSTLVGLLAVLPLAVIPAAINVAIMFTYTKLQYPQRYFIEDEPIWLTLGMTLLGMLVVGRFGYRTAMRELGSAVTVAPSNGKRSPKEIATQILSQITDRLRGDIATKMIPPTAANSLVWQFRNQNRAMVITIIAVFFACLPVIWNNYSERLGPTSLGAVCMIIAYSTASWMAMLAFHGDNVHNRVRFLAERGVSPTRVWWTRHLIPCGFLIVVYTTAWLFILPLDRQHSHSQKETVSHVVVGIAILYAFSQWVGQLVKPAAMAALMAPIIATVAVGFAFSRTWEFGTSLPMLLVSMVGIPMFATWWMMPRWMDGRGGLGYWFRHASLLVLALLIAAAPYTVVSLTMPGFSFAERQQLKIDGERYAATAVKEINLYADSTVEPRWQDFEDPAKQKEMRFAAVDLDALRRTAFEKLSRWVPNDTWSVPAIGYQLTAWQSHVVTLRLTLDTNGRSDDKPANEKRLQEYRDWMRLGQRLVARLRRSTTLASQETADWLEILLLVELNHSETRGRLDPETFAAIVRQVGANDERWEARRRALVMSYLEFYSKRLEQWRDSLNIGGIVLTRKDVLGLSPFERLTFWRERENLFKVLLKYIDDSRRGYGEFPGEYLAQVTNRSPQYYGADPAGPYLRIDDIEEYSSLDAMLSPTIATQWGAGWEQTGREWLEALK